MKKYLFSALALFGALALTAQDTPKNWPHLDLTKDGVLGMSTDKAYEELLNGKSGQMVIVAIIDSGVDAEHEDLADVMWVNADEIPDNGKDDDNNGYIDDIHGWNFIGGPNGTHIDSENLEIIRLYNRYKERFEGADVSKLSKSARKTYDTYKEYEKIINDKREDLAPKVQLYGTTFEMLEAVTKAIGKAPEDITKEDIKAQMEGDAESGAEFVMRFMEEGSSFADIYNDLEGYATYLKDSYGANWNPDFDARDIVGDDPSNLTDRDYGNNDIEGPDAMHGTHVAGIVAAIRNNDIGMNGVISDNVRIMSVRTVPNGDERDKDVANAIYYAVDNGATVINMSFGKGQSPYKGAVDAAMKYAASKDVVLVHAAGNDGKENNTENNFPHDVYAKRGLFGKKNVPTWIEVGAMTVNNDEGLTASFSNYSADYVDVFAPGVEIYATVPDDKYQNLQGTSMAAPQVAGLAALLRSYFPDLTAVQIKEIIMESSVKPSQMVNVPGEEDKKTSLSKISVSGGVANVY
ncbi:MAG: S8 family serine peptidase, partial [Bacteroidota bacterium]